MALGTNRILVLAVLALFILVAQLQSTTRVTPVQGRWAAVRHALSLPQKQPQSLPVSSRFDLKRRRAQADCLGRRRSTTPGIFC
ncbi:hypothetical protein C8F01DRAFT_1133330 [Mycena amicta]|nr:hypothetical protein C8F01DRAFT_1133330 [Mycena amicta]